MDCYSYNSKEWVVSSVLNEERESAAMSRTPSKGLFITGGDVSENTIVVVFWNYSYNNPSIAH